MHKLISMGLCFSLLPDRSILLKSNDAQAMYIYIYNLGTGKKTYFPGIGREVDLYIFFNFLSNIAC